MATTVDIDPNVPPGSESLKLGPSRFQAIEKNLLKIFGFDGSIEKVFPGPFTIDTATGLVAVLGVPTDPLGIVPLSLLQQRTTFISVTSPDGIVFSGTVAEPFSTYATGAIYTVLIAGGTNGQAGIRIQLSDAPEVQVFLADGVTPVPAFKFANGMMFILAYDGANMRIIDFIGGTVPNAITLPANPTANLQAATKQYVDTAVGHPDVSPLGDPFIDAQLTVTNLWSGTITTPNDGNSYILHGDYIVNAQRIGGTNGFFYVWLTDNSHEFAAGGGMRLDSNQSNGALASAGFSPTIYGANETITVTVQAQCVDNPVRVNAASEVSGGPHSALTLTLFRTSP